MVLQNLLGERDSQLAKLGTHEPASSSRQRGGRPNASKEHSNDPDAEARSSVKQEAEALAMHIHQQVRGRQPQFLFLVDLVHSSAGRFGFSGTCKGSGQCTRSAVREILICIREFVVQQSRLQQVFKDAALRE